MKLHAMLCGALCLFALVGVSLAWRTTVGSPTPVVMPATYRYEIHEPKPLPNVRAYMVMDAETGEVLLAKEAAVLLPIASVAKLVVGAAALRTELLSATTTVTRADIGAPEDFGKLAAGDEYTFQELLFPYLLESSNDAGAAIDRTWSELVQSELATLLAEADVSNELVIRDFSGLLPQTVGSAHGLATLLRYLSGTDERVFDITRLPRYMGKQPLVNNNPLITDSNFRGGKHGYTVEAGRTLAARFLVPFGAVERELIVVLLGSEDIVGTIDVLRQRLANDIKLTPQITSSSAILVGS